jgi:ferredoxin
MRITIDPQRCEGHGRCWDNAPGLVEDDDAGRGVVRGDGIVPAQFEEQARAAARACPEQAVILND